MGLCSSGKIFSALYGAKDGGYDRGRGPRQAQSRRHTRTVRPSRSFEIWANHAAAGLMPCRSRIPRGRSFARCAWDVLTGDSVASEADSSEDRKPEDMKPLNRGE